MEQVTAELTILFAEPFWVGIYARTDAGGYQVCRTVFGAEPSDVMVYQWLQRSFSRLRFSPLVQPEKTAEQIRNPKRRQREIRRQLQRPEATGTKAQQALKLQQEQNGIVRQTRQKLQRQEQQRLQYELRQQKKKEKHRGR